MSRETASSPSDRCRLVLAIGPAHYRDLQISEFVEALSAGDVASVIFAAGDLEESDFQSHIEPLVGPAQERGIAVVVAHHSRVAGRLRADGLLLGADQQELATAIDKFSPAMMVGTANVKGRHSALMLGELRPDFIMFGKLGGDIRPEPHPKNLDLGQWWSQMVEIPCIVMGGNDLDCVVDVAKCGAEFVALGDAIFAPEVDAKKSLSIPDRVRLVDQLLEQHAPRFEIVED